MAFRRAQRGQLRVQDFGRNLHQIRHFGPHQRGADGPVRIEPGEHRAVERKLAQIGRRNVFEPPGGGVIRLVVGDQDGVGADRKPVDLAGDGQRGAAGAFEAASSAIC